MFNFRDSMHLTAVLAILVLIVAAPANAECNEAGIAAYSAVQDGNTVTVFANGVHRTGGFENCLAKAPQAVFPPMFEFKIKRPSGGTIQKLTPFTAMATFEAQGVVEHVTIIDKTGSHKVKVVQLSDSKTSSNAKASGLCKVVGKGAVGEPGTSSFKYHKVSGKREVVMVVRTAKSNLCPSTGAVALLIVNGKPVSHGDVTQAKTSIQVSAKPGDHISAIVHTVDLHNDIKCVQLGQLEFTLEQCDLE